MAGAVTPQQQTVASLERVIRENGREPVQRDSYYRPIRSSIPPLQRASETLAGEDGVGVSACRGRKSWRKTRRGRIDASLRLRIIGVRGCSWLLIALATRHPCNPATPIPRYLLPPRYPHTFFFGGIWLQEGREWSIQGRNDSFDVPLPFPGA